MGRAAGLVFSVVAYLVFFATFLYLIAFVGNLPIVARTIDTGPLRAAMTAGLIDLTLVTVFGLQHSVMARAGFKRAWTTIVPHPYERSAYVLFASPALILLFAGWSPLPAVVWSTVGLAAAILWLLFASGWAIVLLTTFLLNHFELFGLQQAWFALKGHAAAAPRFRTPLFYRAVRHPLYTGFFIAFWAAPVMTVGHLLFAAAMSAYMLVAIRFEERDLVGVFGDAYGDYRRTTGMLAPRLRRSVRSR